MKTYDEISKLVNDTYKDNPDIRTVAKDQGLSFDVVWECLGFKDYFDLRRLNGRTNRTTRSWVLCLDVTSSSTQILIHHFQDMVPTGSGIWWVPCSLLFRTDHLRKDTPLKTEHLIVIYKCNKVSEKNTLPLKTERSPFS